MTNNDQGIKVKYGMGMGTGQHRHFGTCTFARSQSGFGYYTKDVLVFSDTSECFNAMGYALGAGLCLLHSLIAKETVRLFRIRDTLI